jgi:glyoxylase-like metal-dependent hydrolase (beta-lactamase superfamily II)
MADDIPFEREDAALPGRPEQLSPLIRRVLCDNPGPFTFKGTVTYVIGTGKVAIVDPGPDNAAHIAAVLEAVKGETVEAILVTHTHRDHSPATAAIKAATGATVYAEGPNRAARALNL